MKTTKNITKLRKLCQTVAKQQAAIDKLRLKRNTLANARTKLFPTDEENDIQDDIDDITGRLMLNERLIVDTCMKEFGA